MFRVNRSFGPSFSCIENASPTFIQAPLPRPLSHSGFGIIVFYTAAGIQHMETEEIFEMFSTINKSPKIGGKLRTVYGLFGWCFPSRSVKKTGPWHPSGNLKYVWPVSLFYNLHKGINASKENPTIFPYLQGFHLHLQTFIICRLQD